MEEMFCFQCQQTAHNSGCEGRAGVCGKKNDTANYQDELTGALIGLSRAVCKKLALNPDASFEHADELILKGLFTTITNVNFFNDTIIGLIREVNVEKDRIYPDIMNYDVHHIWEDQEDIRSLKSLILFGLRGMAAYAYHAYALDYVDRNVLDFFYEGLEALGSEKSSDELLALVLKTGEINFRCMELLDHANSGTYGNPVPTEVPLEGKRINIYTHSEMLPAHGYPELKKYSHLKGNFGTAWQSQQSEFHNIPAPILFTTNCLMPVRQSYCDRVFTTSIVSYPDLVHIGEDKDFTPVIEKALECKGYPEDHPMTGINGGSTVTTGFAHNAVLSNAGHIVELIKAGKIRHIFLIGGCDGAAPGRSYYTDFAKAAPMDTLILTLACGKYRLNDLDLGSIDGIPRILDMGQCNDAYSAIKVALALAEVFDCTVNDLPLTLVLSWYEQKAVCILLTLLSLGVKNILLGPTLPAFVSENVWKILVENYNIQKISTVEEDMKKILG